ncbi:hypothetical protein C7B61_06160 [filamentous cyanobacterium CCP1]|nr:hypothetical protein C7B76_13110 [filamentous cyanobacterium CCP2]PSB67441.1 hypothetical protein C7B61_06160 [filamentous cyanobacterium CCP1]
MGWLSGFFNRNKSQNLQQPANHLDAKNSTTVMQVLVEETIMAVAQWLITFANRSFQLKQNAQDAKVEKAAENHQTAPLEELLSKFGTLVERLYERDQEFSPLYHRLNEIEATLKQNRDLEQYVQSPNQEIITLEERLMQVENQIQGVNVVAIENSLQKGINLEQRAEEFSQSIAVLENRLAHLENISSQLDSLVEKLDQKNQHLQTLENRVQHLEKVLTQFRIVPKLVEKNYRAIVSLQNRLEPAKDTSKNSLRVVSH